MNGLEFDTTLPNPEEFREGINAVQDSLSELLRSISFAIAFKQYCHATNTADSTEVAAEEINAIKEKAYAIADEIAHDLDTGGLTSVEFRYIFNKTTESELNRLASAAIIDRRNKRKYKLDINMFGKHSPTKQATEQAALYSKMLQGVGLNSLRLASGNQLKPAAKGKAVIVKDTLTITFDSYDRLKHNLTTGAKKLLDMGSIRLSQLNHYVGQGKPQSSPHLTTSITIPLEEYGRLRGYDIEERTTTTPEEAEAERKRLDDVYHNMRKAINKELTALFSMSLSWSESSGTSKKRSTRDYADIRLLQAKGIKNGHIHMQFTEPLTRYLTQAYIMPYPKALLSIDERNERAYNVGIKLAYHHGIANNQKRGTNHIISVRELLNACGDMPFIDEVSRGHWRSRIQAPLEKCLDTLCDRKIITRWEYSNAKGTPVTDEQLFSVSYPDFEGLYILFDLPDERQ